jgi:hypothetical protein
MNSGTDYAADGQVYVCGACGKTSSTRYGFDANGRTVSAHGWDESCALNAILCFAEQLGGAWEPVPAAEKVQ